MEFNKEDKLRLLPLILGILGIIIGIIEGLSCPMLYGWESIITEIVIAIVGGLAGIVLYWKTEETFLSGMEFIVTGILMFALLTNMATIGAILFVLTGIIAFFVNGDFSIKNKKLISVPICTVVLLFLMFIIVGFSGAMFESNLANEVSLSNINVAGGNSFGYYEENITADLTLNTSLDYVEADVKYFDKDGKVLRNDIMWNQNNANPGVYKIKSNYFDTDQPTRAEISLKNDATDNDTFYTKNITFSQA
ncbi:MAG: hypothetical protein ACI4VU_02875 [Methanobrevibacter sp.]